MLIQKLNIHDEKIKSINVKNNILSSNSKNKIILYNLNRNMISKIIYVDNKQYVELDDYIYSINNGNTISKTDTDSCRSTTYLGSRISYIITYNSEIYFGVEKGYIYLFKNDKIKQLISYLNFKLTCFYIVGLYTYIGYSNGSIGIFYNNKKQKMISPCGYYGSVISIKKYKNYIYYSCSKGAIKILCDNEYVETINLFSNNITMHTHNKGILVYTNSSISKIKDKYSKKIFQTTDNLCDFSYYNNLMFTSDGDSIKMYLIKLTKNNYNIIPNNIKKYIFYVYNYCNNLLVGDLFFKIINLICCITNVTHP